MRRVLVLLIVFVLAGAPRAEAVSVRDIIELSRAGLGEEVLIALIEVNGRIFSLDAAALRELKEAGVSERVMLAMLRSGRTPDPAPEPPAQATWDPPPPAPWEYVPPPAPQVVVIDHAPPPLPIYVPVVVPVERRAAPGILTEEIQPGRFINTGYRRVEAPAPAPAKPVYWGFGGKRRPGTWGEPASGGGTP